MTEPSNSEAVGQTSILPPNATPLQRAIETALKVRPNPRVVRDLFDPKTCPADLLPWLAWQLGVRRWDNGWPLSVRRERVRRAAEIQRKKGTIGAVRAAVSVFGGNIAIREWWQKTPKGTPHTFDLILSLSGSNGEAPPAALIEQVIDEVRMAKPLRSHFTFALAVQSAAPIGVHAVARTVNLVRVRAVAP